MKAAAAIALLLLGACDNMVQQRRADEYETSALFANGMAMQAPPHGTVARGEAPSSIDSWARVARTTLRR